MRSLARALDSAVQTRSRLEKVAYVASALRDAAGRPSDLATTARLLAGRLTASDGAALGVGGAVIVEAASLVRGVPAEWIARRARELGDLGDAVAELLAAPTYEARHRALNQVAVPDARQLSLVGRPDQWTLPADGDRHHGLPLRALAEVADAIAAAPSREAKIDFVAVALSRTTAAESRYFVKALLGELRVGVRSGIVEEAMAKAFDASVDDVRAAAAVEADPGAVALRAQAGTLAAARAQVFHPIQFMLAAADGEVATPVSPAATVLEDKLDGVRAQLHVQAGEVKLFARGQGDVASTFPEVAAAFRAAAGPLVFDGELIAVGADGRPRPFQALQARLGRSAPDAAVLADVPVRYFVFDLLLDGESLLPAPWQERRARLERVMAELAPSAASVLPYAPLPSDDDAALEQAYEAARARGHEGIVLKRVDAPYEAGRRGGAWRKVKRAFATLDVVMTAAERGHGRRAGVLSDYTFAVWRGADLVDVGKAYSGLTDAEIGAVAERIEALTSERRGALQRVRPGIVLEVAFDGVQRSERHPSGFALRFPRIARLREDKKPEEADTLEAVERLFQEQVKSGHREDEPVAALGAAASPKGRRRGGSLAQLGLFDPSRRDEG